MATVTSPNIDIIYSDESIAVAAIILDPTKIYLSASGSSLIVSPKIIQKIYQNIDFISEELFSLTPTIGYKIYNVVFDESNIGISVIPTIGSSAPVELDNIAYIQNNAIMILGGYVINKTIISDPILINYEYDDMNSDVTLVHGMVQEIRDIGCTMDIGSVVLTKPYMTNKILRINKIEPMIVVNVDSFDVYQEKTTIERVAI